MNTNKARNLKVGDRVIFSDGVEGKVIERGYGCVKIAWDDGQTGLVDFNDFQNIQYVKAMNTKTQTSQAIINVTCGTAVKPSSSFYAMFAENQIGDRIELAHSLGRAAFHYMVVTPEQAESFERVVKHQGKENLMGVSMEGFCGDYCLALTFRHIMIGIEADGYAHS